MKIESSDFGSVNDQKVQLFTLSNDTNIAIKLSNYGGIVTSVEVPDKNGIIKNVVLGFDDLSDYLSDDYLKSYPYFGCLIGRVGNRINKGKFQIDGKNYQVSKNRDSNHLHGGFIGFDRVIWNASSFEKKDSVGVELTYLSVDGEEGYPGNLKVKVIYSLSSSNELGVEYFATTDKATPVNLTQHSYFNLGNERTIKNHVLELNSTEFNEVDAESIPTGKMVPVQNTLFDFRKKKKIGRDIDSLEFGYDNNFALIQNEKEIVKAAELLDEASGRRMEVYTTEVGIQLYTGAYIPELEFNGVKKFGPFSGVALETQHFPDAVNHPQFSSTVLRPGEILHQKTTFKFSVER